MSPITPILGAVASPRRARGLLAGCLAAAALATMLPGRGDTPLTPQAADRPGGARATRPLPEPVDAALPFATAAPAPTAAASADPGVGGGGRAGGVAPRYVLVYRIRIPAQGIDLPVISVDVVHGAMDAPEGPPESAFWHESFWLDRTVHPGDPGTATVAGHLDDTLGRPAGFWNVRNLSAGGDVFISTPDGAQSWHYRITETRVLTYADASSPANLARLYGSPLGGAGDGVARLTLVTCTGTFHRGGTGYDHRFEAYATLVP